MTEYNEKKVNCVCRFCGRQIVKKIMLGPHEYHNAETLVVSRCPLCRNDLDRKISVKERNQLGRTIML